MKSFKLIGLAFGASLALSTAAFAEDITIAVAGPMTGGESAFGRQMKNGAEMAVKDLNAANDLFGMKAGVSEQQRLLGWLAEIIAREGGRRDAGLKGKIREANVRQPLQPSRPHVSHDVHPARVCLGL